MAAIDSARATHQRMPPPMTLVIVARILWSEHRDAIEKSLRRGGYVLTVIDDEPGTDEEIVELYCLTESARCTVCEREVLYTGRASPVRPDGPRVERAIRYPLLCPRCGLEPGGHP